ncbi:helix-turn-helix domain-containing protein [Delftia tsuruhatensis]|uniref:helix-turn-helix domain-containing protein n=1 Tax=Delftia tsuruhatensis TaxID=180282 RepID=UPI0023DA7C72|nr:helix-turn-helix domain-containing protein [Delftia tsuruhatensis]MDH0847439.1 helix-turn-helix domain-containing protein [Delftia tsuruhatensis]WEL97019.1 helix-turn-helix domain-containing protein [Delftia tsuruhatensis]WQM84845.1 helix-turn-helix domain-containing protein [Delftia tsuruhatensis]
MRTQPSNTAAADLPSAHKISTACAKLAISRATIYRMAKAGQLELIRVSKGATRVTDESLRRVLNARQPPPSAVPARLTE